MENNFPAKHLDDPFFFFTGTLRDYQVGLGSFVLCAIREHFKRALKLARSASVVQ